MEKMKKWDHGKTGSGLTFDTTNRANGVTNRSKKQKMEHEPNKAPPKLLKRKQ
jgi:hypothetical protein